MAGNFATVQLSKQVKDRLDKAKGEASSSSFISFLLDRYDEYELFIKSCNNAVDELKVIKQQNNTNLGLLCETLRKLGVINDDGVIIASIED